MRRLLATLTVLAACLFGLPATATAAPAPLGGGSILFSIGGTARCTAAFAATGGSTGYLVTGPGCSGGMPTQLYSGNNVLVGPVVSASASGVTLVKVTNTAAWTLVAWIPVGSGRLVVAGSAETPVGGSVCLIDRVLGFQCGTVTAKNQTVSFPGGVVSGLTRTTICMSAGSAVAFVSGNQAQGVPIGGSGSCPTGGVSYFLPINPLLSGYGLMLLTG
ncbi:S1 family peptidase [Actinophytocola sp.]|uniref:S1 family peptidase n=1 Tax=Actinophytocola sp. TaxID=1872138 RepID=UPI002ED97945